MVVERFEFEEILEGVAAILLKLTHSCLGMVPFVTLYQDLIFRFVDVVFCLTETVNYKFLQIF